MKEQYLILKKITMLSDGKERHFYGVKLVIDGIIIQLGYYRSVMAMFIHVFMFLKQKTFYM